MKYQMLEKCDGCVLAMDLIDDNNLLILKKGTVIDNWIITRLKNFGIFSLGIEDPMSDDIDISSPVSDKTVIEACHAIDTNNPTARIVDIDKVFQAASKLVDEICQNVALVKNGYHTIKMYDENTSLHSVNVAILAAMFGLSLGFNIRKINNLGVGGLLHDIGKSRVPIEIINKSGKLDAEELAEMRKHPQYGLEILQKDILIPATVKAIAYQHHENWDGTGYPRGLREHEVYELAAIVHICDVFDALISKRSYKDSFSFSETIQYMKEQSGKMFSPYYIKYFFRNIPVFHTGTDVILSNNEKAIVVRNNYGDMTRPVVRLYSDMSEVDLSKRDDMEIIS